MKPAGLRVMSKHYWVNSTDKIWIKALDLGNDIWWDWIRIEAGGEAHLVIRTGLHEWTFFDWNGFALIETFDVSALVGDPPAAQPYIGEATNGTQICAAAGGNIIIGTGTGTPGSNNYWLVAGKTPHKLVFGPRSDVNFYDTGLTGTSAFRWACRGVTEFVHWSIGTDPGDPPFDGSGWLATRVSAVDFSTLSQASFTDDNAAVVTGNVRDDSNTGYSIDIPDAGGAFADLFNPLSTVSKPDAQITFSSGLSTLAFPMGVPNRVWRVVSTGGFAVIELCQPNGTLLASASINPSTSVEAVVVDSGQALVFGVAGDSRKGWHLVESTDPAGNSILTATDVTSVGVISFVLSKFTFWLSGPFGVGLHLIDRQF